MRCPLCGHADTKVVDSRATQEGGSVRRRRECEACQYRFSTVEEIELLGLTVVKRDGHREGYSREKVAHGLKKALEKRAYTEADFHQLVQAIELDIQRRRVSELRAAEIGEIIMTHLKKFDKVAYIRFASVYRSFEDVETFQAELARLVTKKRSAKPDPRKETLL
jgi:transcriptional repressor NrdR